ncbi:MAG: hypothetical protein MZV49_08900 [Rhodopseudomonas palustris]|nr:hypothetical protein [Rhodopseudomonas palustris]
MALQTLLGDAAESSQDLFVAGGGGLRLDIGRFSAEAGADLRVFYYSGTLLRELAPYCRIGILLF